MGGIPVAALALAGTYLLVLSVAVYFCVCADPRQSRTAKFLTVTIPTLFWETLAKLLGPRAFDSVSYVLDRSLLLFYCVIVFGSWSIIFAYVYPWIGQQTYLSQFHRMIGIAVFASCVVSWHWAHTTSPGLITAETIAQYDHFPYDDLLFEAGKVCPTRKIPKLARSKFDRFKYHENIPRFDHFCGWVHNTIGEENYRFFLLFLLVHVCVSACFAYLSSDSFTNHIMQMCWYGSYAVAMLFYGEILDKELLTVTFFDRFTGEEVGTSYWILFQYMFQSHFAEASVLIIMIAMSIALSLFLSYHIWLTSRGLTTNESYKWDAIVKWHQIQSKRFRANDTEDDPGEAPVNLYHRGIIENWKEVIVPISLRSNQNLSRRKDE